jgi:hypothetical protein
MTFYIDGPNDRGEGIYDLITEEGQHLASHYCSTASYSLGDLESRRPERQKEWKAKFGDYQIVYLGDDAMTREELVTRNNLYYEKEETAE